jgi:hypothetical protein
MGVPTIEPLVIYRYLLKSGWWNKKAQGKGIAPITKIAHYIPKIAHFC